MIKIYNNQLRLFLDPNSGVGTKALEMRRGEHWLSIMPDTRSSDCNLPFANFLMIPYSNRIKDGQFTFENKNYYLANGESHSIHGDVRNRKWKISEHTTESIICTIDSRQNKDINWPWDFCAKALFKLDGLALHMQLSITNVSTTNMPAALGWHPYFNRKITSHDEQVLLHFPLKGVYPDANNTRIPSGPLTPLDYHQNFDLERELFKENFLDLCYHGFSGGSITWPKSRLRLKISTNDICQHLIIYNPPETDYFAIEPVSNANNGVNLFSQGDQTSGIRVLTPQDTLTATCRLQLEEYK